MDSHATISTSAPVHIPAPSLPDRGRENIDHTATVVKSRRSPTDFTLEERAMRYLIRALICSAVFAAAFAAAPPASATSCSEYIAKRNQTFDRGKKIRE